MKFDFLKELNEAEIEVIRNIFALYKGKTLDIVIALSDARLAFCYALY